MTDSEKFISLLSVLDEDYYFFLVSTYLGKIPAPFHKPALNNQLVGFFINEANQKNIVASVDKTDALFLTIIMKLGSCSQAQISSVFLDLGSDISFAQIVTNLENLADRLLIIPSGSVFVVNPLLQGIFQEKVFDLALLFPSDSKKSEPKAIPTADQNVLRAVMNLMISGLAHSREANFHHFQKSGKLEEVFPQFSAQQSLDIFQLFKALALSFNAIEVCHNGYTINLNQAKALLELNTLDLNLAAIDNAAGKSVHNAVSDALGLLNQLPSKQDTFLRMLELMLIKDQVHVNTSEILSHLLTLGLVGRTDDWLFVSQSLLNDNGESRSDLMVDSDMSISYFGKPRANDILFLFADIVKCDNMVSYSLSKASFTRALNLGLTREEIGQFLGNSSLNALLDQWNNSYTRINLYEGLVVKCNSEVSSLITEIPQFKAHIIKRIDKDIFLMKTSTQAQWKPILAQIFDLEELPQAIKEKHEDGINPIEVVHCTIPLISAMASEHAIDPSIRENLEKDALDKNCLSPELKELIRTRLVISPSQISPKNNYNLSPSASGFDFTSKVMLIKEAIKNPHYLARLELLDQTIIARPIETTGLGTHNSIVKVLVLPSEIERNIAVSSIFRITLVRRSMV